MRFIANPNAAGGRHKEAVPALLAEHFGSLQPKQIVFTQYAHHAVELVRSLVDGGEREIVSVGGDGTAFEVINGIMQSGSTRDVRFGIIPLGTGNSFLCDFGVSGVESAIQRIIGGKTRAIDIGKITSLDDGGELPVYFHNQVGFGFVAQACKARWRLFRRFGKYGYHAAVFYLLPSLAHYDCSLKIDGAEAVDVRTPLLSICNSQYTGYNMHISPDSSVHDGRMELLYTKDLSRMELLQLFSAMPTGKHLQHAKVHVVPFQTLEIRIGGIDYYMVDGELLDGGSLWVEVLPSALQLFC